MGSKTQVNLSDFITSLLLQEEKSSEKDFLALGKTFTYNAEITRINLLFSGDRKWPKTIVTGEFDIKDPVAAFYIFTLLFHKSFNFYFKKNVLEFETKINQLADLLKIEDRDKQEFTLFFSNDEPYTDKNKAVYFTAHKKAGLSTHVGAHIMHVPGKNNEIVYLKYFEKYGLFLSKLFIRDKNPYHFVEHVTVKEINILHPGNYLMDDYGYNTFEEIVDSVLNHNFFQHYELPATANTPKIILDPENGRIIISGSSSPFSPTHFFTPILEWIESFGASEKMTLKIFIMLDYFNTYTSKFLLRLCRRCDTLAKEGKDIRIYWYFDPEDTDMREFGEHLGGIYKKGFEYCLITDGIEQLT